MIHSIFRYLLLVIFVFTVLNANSQRGEVPRENSENALDLKVVFQEYETVITNQYGHTLKREENEYLNLKVNGMYLENGSTGITSSHFKRYLSNCPKALNLGLKGLNSYKKSNWDYRFSNWTRIIGFVGAASILYSSFSDDHSVSPIAIGATTLGFGGSFILKWMGRKREQQGDQMIVDAFDLYNKECFRSDLYQGQLKNDDTANGKSNKDEKILLDFVSHDIHARMISISPQVGFSVLEALVPSYGLQFTYFKKGLSLKANGFLNSSILNHSDFPDSQYGWSGLVSVPLLKSERKVKSTFLRLGKMQGLEATVKIEDKPFTCLRSIGIDLGIDYNQFDVADQINLINDFWVKSTHLRAGLSLSKFSEFKFKINDNRFSEKMRCPVFMSRLYLNAIYNQKNNYQVYSSTILHTDPELPDSDFGFVIGWDLIYSSNPKNRSFTFSIELGKYPIFNEYNGIGGIVKLGYGFHSVR